MAEVQITDQLLPIQIDTGASLSTMSEEMYWNLNARTLLPLTECSTALTTYTGESLHVLGKVSVPVK